jgi:hypothetical protein
LVTKTVKRFLKALMVLEVEVFFRRLFGALSQALGSSMSLLSASSLTACLTRSQKDPYFWGPG